MVSRTFDATSSSDGGGASIASGMRLLRVVVVVVDLTWNQCMCQFSRIVDNGMVCDC